jgi:hypothetical protein
MFVSYRGGVYSRPGTRYVATSRQSAGTGDSPPRLIAWQFNNQQGYVLEFGDLYVRFIFNGGYVLSGGSPYQITSPYSAVQAFQLKFVQSADVMTLCHPNFKPYDLARVGPTSWTLTPTPVGATNAPPTSVTASATTTPSGSLLPCAYAYQVTAVDAVTGQESSPSNIADVTNSVDMSATAGSIILNWTAASGTPHYYKIYRAPTSYNTGNSTNALPVPGGAIFGYIGQTLGTQFVDSNIVPNYTLTPPIYQNPIAPGSVVNIDMTASSGGWVTATVTISSITGSLFSGQPIVVNGFIVGVKILNGGISYDSSADTVVFAGTGGASATANFTTTPLSGTYPSVDAYFQQRRFFAGSINQPDTYFASKPGQFNNFSYSLPSQDDDALEGTPWSGKVDGIQWFLQMPLGLLAFTGSGVQQIGAQGSFTSSPQGLTPTTQFAFPQSSIGISSTVPPLQINWDVLYLDYNGDDVLDLAYQLYFNIYAGTDISWPSSHLLGASNHTIIEWCYCRNPGRIVWAARDDGALLSLTYLKEQEVAGWARHDTWGQVKSICSIVEGFTDALYLVVERPVPNGLAYFIERMDDRQWAGVEDCWCVDAGIATIPNMPAAKLTASSVSGAVVFHADHAVFNSGENGQVLRFGGGIALITAYVDSTHLSGTWVYPCQELYPNAPTPTPLPQPQGRWTLLPRVTTVGGFSNEYQGTHVVGLADGVPIGLDPALRPLYPWLPAVSFGFLTVSGGNTVTLPFTASKVVLGFGFTAQLQSVYLDTGEQPTIQGRRKNIYAATVRCQASGFSQVGINQADASAASPMPQFEVWPGLPAAVPTNVQPNPAAPYTSVGGISVQPLFTGDQRLIVPSAWAKPGQVAVQQMLPLPVNVTALIPEVLEGDTAEMQIQPRQQSANSNGRRAA